MATTSSVSQASAELACSPRRSGENLPEEMPPEHHPGSSMWPPLEVEQTTTKNLGLSLDSDTQVRA